MCTCHINELMTCTLLTLGVCRCFACWQYLINAGGISFILKVLSRNGSNRAILVCSGYALSAASQVSVSMMVMNDDLISTIFFKYVHILDSSVINKSPLFTCSST